MFPAIFFLLSLTALILATRSDLKSRVIPNRLTYSLIAAGIALQFAYSLALNDWLSLAVALAAGLATFAASYLLWRLGVWAGGDVKLMTGLAILNPVNHFALGGFLGLKAGIFAPVQAPVFPLTLFIFSVFSMLPYAAFISLNAVARRAELRAELAAEMKKRGVQLAKFSAAVSGFGAVLLFFGQSSLLLLPMLLAAGLLKSAGIALVALAFGFALLQNPMAALAGFFALFLSMLFLYLIIKLAMMSRTRVLKKEVRITELKEGMIVAETIRVEGGRAKRSDGMGMQKIINHLMNNSLHAVLEEMRPRGRVIASRHRAAGLTENEIRELRELVKEKKLEDGIRVSESAPFVPAVLIGYVVLQMAGDVLWNLLF